MMRNFRKPLIIAAPKIGLKHPKAVSEIADFAPGTKFTPTIAKDYHDSSNIKKLVLCSGKVAFDIEAALQKEGALSHGVRVVRLEEIAPFPIQDLRAYMGGVSKDTDVVWM